MSSEPISPSNLPPESCSARLSASSSRVRGSRPAAISFGRSTISPTPTMTGMRSSGTGEGVFMVFCFHFLAKESLILRSGRLAASRRMDATLGLAAILRDAREERAPQDEVGDTGTLLRHQRIHV